MGVKWFVYKKHLIKDKIILKDRIQIKKLKTKLDYEGVSPIVLVKYVRTPWCEVRHRNSPHNLHGNCVSGVTLETIPNLIFCKCLVQIVNGQMNNLFGVI